MVVEDAEKYPRLAVKDGLKFPNLTLQMKSAHFLPPDPSAFAAFSVFMVK